MPHFIAQTVVARESPDDYSHSFLLAHFARVARHEAQRPEKLHSIGGQVHGMGSFERTKAMRACILQQLCNRAETLGLLPRWGH